MRVVTAETSQAPVPRSRATALSVLVAGTEGAEGLVGCLASLAESPPPGRLSSVIVVVSNRSDAVADGLESLSRRLSDTRIRVLEAGAVQVAEAFVLAAACASDAEVLLVRSSDRWSGVRESPDLHSWSGALVRRELFVRAGDELASAPTPEVFWCRLLDGQDVPDGWLPCEQVDSESGTHAVEPSQAWRRIAELENCSPVDARSAQLRTKLIASLARRINRHLRAHPADRDRSVEEATSLGLREVPWPVVNEGLARDLAVAYCFPPALDTSGLVAAKRLRARGLVTDVISHDLSKIRTIDPASLQLAGPALGRIRVVPGHPTFIGWHSIRKFSGAAWDAVVEWEAAQGSYRSVYSRAMAVGSHYAAAVIKGRRPQVRWVAEHSDPLAVNELGEYRDFPVRDDWLSAELTEVVRAAGFHVEPHRRLFEWAEHLTYALADEIVFTNEHQRALMLDGCSDPALAERARAISRVDPHPVPPASLYDHSRVEIDLPAGVAHLAYFGVFYGTRDLGDVVAALQALRQAERDRVHLHVFTSKPEELTLAMAEAGLSGVVSAYPYRPVLEFLNLTTRFDVLLVDDARTADHHRLNPYLPSKLADYRGSRTAIWTMSEPGSVLSQQDVAYSSTLGDQGGSLEVLRRIIGDHSGRGAAAEARHG